MWQKRLSAAEIKVFRGGSRWLSLHRSFSAAELLKLSDVRVSANRMAHQAGDAARSSELKNGFVGALVVVSMCVEQRRP